MFTTSKTRSYKSHMLLQVVGLNTNLEFLRRLTLQPEFIEGKVHTGFIEEHSQTLLAEQPAPTLAIVQVYIEVLA